MSVAAEWHITDPLAWLGVARAPEDALWIVVQLVVRVVFAARAVETLVTDREQVARELLTGVAAESRALGVEMLRVEIRDLAPPPEVRRSALALHTARADGLARLERARAETAALRALANGAKILTDHPGLLQLRTAEAVAQAGGVVKLSVGG